MKACGKIILLLCLVIPVLTGKSQTVFTALKSQQKQADQNFSEQNYWQAISLYKNLLNKNGAAIKNTLRLAQSYYNTRQYENAIQTYASYSKISSASLPIEDLYRYAEAQAVLQHYHVAISYYTLILQQEPENELIAKKIWRLNNIQYLYEDSAHYLIRPIPSNSRYSEIYPVRLLNGVVFTSNRKSSHIIEHVNQQTLLPFYQLYFSKTKPDSVNVDDYLYDRPAQLDKVFKTRYNMGPAAFYKNERSMVFVATSENVTAEGKLPLGIYFAEYINGEWKRTKLYEHNSNSYSIFDVSINEDGDLLFFSSDMREGYGGRDIYVSRLQNGKWTKPENLGEFINTSKDECAPFYHPSGKFFFASNGHSGFGGLDIFRVDELASQQEPENLGYPINSSYDDFGINLDLHETKGLLSSNRNGKGFDDDIYEFDIDLQTYPFTISGVIQIKPHSLSDHTEIQLWSDKEVALIDSRLGKTVFRTTTDSAGKFKIEIPYFGKYLIQIVDEDGNIQSASLEIQKNKNSTSEYEIVMVKDIFNRQAN